MRTAQMLNPSGQGRASGARLATALLLAVLWVGRARADSQQTYLQCLTNFETYAESIWHTASYSGAPADAGYWGDGGSTGNGGIRGNSGVAVAYAVLVLAQPTDPRTTTRLAHIRQALNYDAATHVTGANNTVSGARWGWSSGTLATCTSQSGADWQSAEWSGSMGLACLLVQTNLPLATVQAVQRVVASEADHRAAIPPCTRDLSSGDTKAEENGWDGNILALAAAWMSTSNNAATWLTAAQSYLANTYTVANTAGDPLSNWVSTVTLFPDFALENHGFYHPTYEMVAGMSSGDSLLMARLADTNIATQLLLFAEHNVITVWTTNLASMLLDSGEFAYPSGLDWELHDYEQNSYITWMAAHFNDPVARWADAGLAQLVRYRQTVNNDGTHNGMFVGPSVNQGSGDPFFREAVEARRTAIAWLHWANADFPSGPTSAPPATVVHFSDVGVIAQRSPWSFVTVSYKTAIMGMVEASASSVPTNPFVATPALPGGFGHGPLGNPTAATLVSLATNSLGFAAQLLVQNGANGQTRVCISSSGESIGIVEVPLPANGVTGSSVGCFTNGIENDPLCGGSRLVEWSGGSSNVTAFSNARFNITNNWVCLSSHYGLAAGPGGYFTYRSASGYNRAGAAQDYLSLTPQTRLGPRYAAWFPAKTAAQTAALATQISWTTNGSTVVLSFPGASNSTQTIIASLVSNNGSWTNDASGNWSDASNWAAGIVADGAGNSADFSTVNLTGDRTVTLDSSRSIGTLKFGDTSGAQNWSLNASGGSVLTLSASAPAIAVNQNTATIGAPLDGTVGFTKSGPGTMVLAGSNTISGTLFTDSNSTSANDGAVRIASRAALGSLSSIMMRNNTGANAASTLQLDGSSGGIVVSAPITCDCRANTIPCVQNLAGSNLVNAAFSMQTGGSNVVFESDSGTLVFAGPLQYIGSLTAARYYNIFGAGDTLISGPILFSSVAPLNVGKYGSGTLFLNGAHTYTGTTMVFAGTLAGTGTISGPVTVLAGATLSPGGGAVGALTINNSLTCSGTVAIHLSKSGGTLTNDSIRGLTTVTYGGTLQLIPTGNQITAGDSFQIFVAGTCLGSFANVLPATPGVGLVWDTSNLAVNGTLAVGLGLIQPHIASATLAGTDLVCSGSGGAAGTGFSLLASTNVAAPLTAWPVVSTGVCDTNGNFTFTNAVSAGVARKFFALRFP